MVIPTITAQKQSDGTYVVRILHDRLSGHSTEVTFSFNSYAEELAQEYAKFKNSQPQATVVPEAPKPPVKKIFPFPAPTTFVAPAVASPVVASPNVPKVEATLKPVETKEEKPASVVKPVVEVSANVASPSTVDAGAATLESKTVVENKPLPKTATEE